MFDADFTIFKHVASGKESILTLSYSIPASLESHLSFVHPTTKYVLHNTYYIYFQKLELSIA